MLSVLDLFTIERPRWTVEEIAEALRFTQSTAYRYVSTLCGSGLIAPMGTGQYALGPRVIELDRQIRLTDPLIGLTAQIAPRLLKSVPKGVVTLASLRGDAVLSVFQARKPADIELSFERGRSMDLFRGAAAKAILAHLPRARLMRLFLYRQPEIASATLGRTWQEFWTAVQALRRQPAIVSRGEAEVTSWGVAAPVFDLERNILSSITLIMPIGSYTEKAATRLSRMVSDAATSIKAGLAQSTLAETVATDADETERMAG